MHTWWTDRVCHSSCLCDSSCVGIHNGHVICYCIGVGVRYCDVIGCRVCVRVRYCDIICSCVCVGIRYCNVIRRRVSVRVHHCDIICDCSGDRVGTDFRTVYRGGTGDCFRPRSRGCSCNRIRHCSGDGCCRIWCRGVLRSSCACSRAVLCNETTASTADPRR
jgi:hypothetical protein